MHKATNKAAADGALLSYKHLALNEHLDHTEDSPLVEHGGTNKALMVQTVVNQPAQNNMMHAQCH